MRVSTLGAFRHGLELMQRLQSALDHTQRQISTGRRILTPSDDPIASARAVDVRESIARLEQFDRNANIATNRLAQEEVALQAVTDVLQRVRELGLQASNATQGNESRAQIAVELRQLLDSLVQIANQKDGNGTYLFAGNREGTQPVSRSGTSFTYNGDQGQRSIQIGEGRYVFDGDSGAEVFFTVRAENGTFRVGDGVANTGTGVDVGGSVLDPTAWVPDQYTVQFISPNSYEVLDSSSTVISTGTFQSGDSIAFRGIEFRIDGEPATGDQFIVAPSENRNIFSFVLGLAATVDKVVTDDTSRAAMNNDIASNLMNPGRANESRFKARGNREPGRQQWRPGAELPRDARRSRGSGLCRGIVTAEHRGDDAGSCAAILHTHTIVVAVQLPVTTDRESREVCHSLVNRS